MKKEQKKCLKCRGTRHRAQKEKGITLISLVITIIILLILAGVTLKIVIDNNFIDKTITATDKYAIAQQKEAIDLIKTSILINNLGNKEKVNLKDQLKTQLEKEEWVTTVRTNTENETLEENQIEIITKENYRLVIEITEQGDITYITEDKYDGEPYPKIILLEQLPLEGTQNEKTKIKIITEVEKIKKTKNIEKIELIKEGKVVATKTYEKENKTKIEDIFEVEESGTYTLKVTTNTGKTTSKKISVVKVQGTTNKVKVVVDIATPRNTTKEGTQNGIETGPIKVTITYTENEQTNLQKQYSLDGGKNWINTDKTLLQIPITENTTIIGRYTDGTNSFNVETYNIQNVDNIAPTIQNYEIEAKGTTITVNNVKAQDTASEGAVEGEHPTAGIEKILYSIDGTNYQEQNTFNITEAKQYTIYVKAIDKAGNEVIKDNKTINAYQINFNATGGTVEPTNKIALENTTYGQLPTPTKEGHTFKGWYTEENGETQIQENDKVTANQTLYARWEAGQYTITAKHYLENANEEGYEYQGEEKDTISVVSYGTNINLEDKAITIQNAKYAKGSLQQNGAETTSIKITENTTIHLYYNRDRYSVKLNKGTNIETVTAKATQTGIASSDGKYKVGQNVTIEAETVKEVTGHSVTWAGWTGTFTKSNNPYIFEMPANNIELTANAKITANPYTLKYEVNGGNALNPSSKTITFNQKYGDLPTPTRTGYTFEGWYTAASEGDLVTKDTVLTTEGDKTIYAHWKADKIESDETIKTTTTKLLPGNYAYSNPPIPAGFRTLDTVDAKWESTDGVTVAGWDNGLVITDASNGVDGNEFVWVPVNGTNVTYGYHYNVNSTGDTSLEKELPSGVTSEETQINKYHGFYIARYEAGTELEYNSRNTVATPLSKKNKDPWNNISWTNSKNSAERMYNTTNVKSGLITDRMWETTCKWLESSGGVNVTTDCRSWGNYKNNSSAITGITRYSTNYGQNWSTTGSYTKNSGTNWLLPTGNTNYTKRKNIYDLAGNLRVWTNAAYNSSSSYFVYRGGFYGVNGMSYTAAYRSYNSDVAYSNIGFRVGLYIQ